MLEKVNEALEFIKEKISLVPEQAVILGSGLGNFAESIVDKIYIPYSDIPHFPLSTVRGHAGRLVIGQLSGINIIAMQGRFHYYEGYDMKETVFPIWVMRLLGIEKLIVTNAAGGINTDYKPGELMLIKDHINFMGSNPLIGPNLSSMGTRFPDMSNAYSSRLRDLIKSISYKLNIPIREGVYASMTGPAYETPAEIKMLRIMGADAVGMSTVPEVIAANHAGMEVAGISCITNMAAGVLDKPLSHEEVIKTADEVKDKFIKLVISIINEI